MLLDDVQDGLARNNLCRLVRRLRDLHAQLHLQQSAEEGEVLVDEVFFDKAVVPFESFGVTVLRLLEQEHGFAHCLLLDLFGLEALVAVDELHERALLRVSAVVLLYVLVDDLHGGLHPLGEVFSDDDLGDRSRDDRRCLLLFGLVVFLDRQSERVDDVLEVLRTDSGLLQFLLEGGDRFLGGLLGNHLLHLRLWEVCVPDEVSVAEQLAPDVVGEMRGDRREQQCLDSDEADDNRALHLEAECIGVASVVVTRSLQVVEAVEKRLAIKGLLVRCVGRLDATINLRHEDLVVEVVVVALIELRLERVLGPAQEGVELHQPGGGILLAEVGVVHAVASVGEPEAHAVGGVLLDGLGEREEVAGGLCHLLVVDEQVAVGSERLREVLGAPDGDMVQKAEGQVVGEQILPGDSQVERVPIGELVAHHVEVLLGDLAVLRVLLLPAEDVVPDLGGHVLGGDVEQPVLVALQIGLEEVRDGVVRHVDGRVGEGLDEVLGVPRDSGAQAE